MRWYVISLYIDPPFNTGKLRKQTRLKLVQDQAGAREGFQGRRYKTLKKSEGAGTYADSFEDGEISFFFRAAFARGAACSQRFGLFLSPSGLSRDK